MAQEHIPTLVVFIQDIQTILCFHKLCLDNFELTY